MLHLVNFWIVPPRNPTNSPYNLKPKLWDGDDAQWEQGRYLPLYCLNPSFTWEDLCRETKFKPHPQGIQSPEMFLHHKLALTRLFPTYAYNRRISWESKLLLEQ